MHRVTVFYTRILIILSLLFFPFIFFLIWHRKKTKIGGKLKILVIPQLTRIGDIVCSTPVFSALKERYPDSHLSVLSSLNAVGIIKNNPRIDKIILVENFQNNFLALVNKIRLEKFDIGISLSGTALSSLLFFFGLIPERIKITRPNRPLAELLTDWLCNKIEKYVTLSYLPLFYLGLLKHLDIYKTNVKKEVFFNKESEQKIVKFLIEKGIEPNDKVVGISLSAGNKIKEWGDNRFMGLAKEINRKYNFKIIFIGAPRDKRRIDWVIEELDKRDQFIDGAGFDLADLPAMMKRFNFFISVDTGPIHIAEALNIPLIDILGLVNDIELTPRGENIKIIKPSADIPPTIFAFYEVENKDFVKNAPNSITVEKVLKAFDELVR